MFDQILKDQKCRKSLEEVNGFEARLTKMQEKANGTAAGVDGDNYEVEALTCEVLRHTTGKELNILSQLSVLVKVVVKYGFVFFPA